MMGNRSLKCSICLNNVKRISLRFVKADAVLGLFFNSFSHMLDPVNEYKSVSKARRDTVVLTYLITYNCVLCMLLIPSSRGPDWQQAVQCHSMQRLRMASTPWSSSLHHNPHRMQCPPTTEPARFYMSGLSVDL